MSSLQSLLLHHQHDGASTSTGAPAAASTSGVPAAANLVRKHGGIIEVPKGLLRSGSTSRKTNIDYSSASTSHTKLLLNVDVQRSFGSVHELMSSENTSTGAAAAASTSTGSPAASTSTGAPGASTSTGAPAAANLVRKHGGIIEVPKRLLRSGTTSRKTNIDYSSASTSHTKLLLNVDVQRSFGAVHVLMSSENTVRDLIKAAIDIYVEEKRRPLLTDTDLRCFELHYSQFSTECLKPEEKLINLGSRNFFLFAKANTKSSRNSSSCFYESENSPFPFIKFMDFLL